MRKTSKTTRKHGNGKRVPVLRIHKQSQRCYATFNGKIVWFGARNGPETQARFDAHLAQWLARGRKAEQPRDASLTVRSVVARYLLHREAKSNGSWQDDRLTVALKPLLHPYDTEPAAEFSPLNFKTVRHAMIASARLCRTEINVRVQAIRRCFRWTASDNLVPTHLSHGLQSVEHLRIGEYGVREGLTREPVTEEVVLATLEYRHPLAATLVELLLLTGARPSEICNLCPQDIDRSGNVWVAVLQRHKTAKQGNVRETDFGPKTQSILHRFLD